MRVDTVRDLADRRGVAPPSATRRRRRVAVRRTPDHFIDQYGDVCNLLQEPGRVPPDRLRALRRPRGAGRPLRRGRLLARAARRAPRRLVRADRGGARRVRRRRAGHRCHHARGARRDPRLRHRDWPRRSLQVALKYVGRGVVSLNCAGSERGAIAPYADIFRRAVEGGLHSTPHAGEWSGPQNVWDTLEHLRPERIGHGVRSIDDPRLVERLAELRDPAGGLPVVERRHRRLRVARRPSVPAAPRGGRRGDAQLRRPRRCSARG